jgi:hypothetical protein
MRPREQRGECRHRSFPFRRPQKDDPSLNEPSAGEAGRARRTGRARATAASGESGKAERAAYLHQRNRTNPIQEEAMTDLLEMTVAAHGGLERWERISEFRTAASIAGAIWDLKGRPGLLERVVLAGETRDQRMRIEPFPGPGRYATWEPGRQTIETADGVVLEERLDPKRSFEGQTRESQWDELHVAYFAGEANWNYLVTPFVFTRRDFRTEELEPWNEDGQVWRRLLVTYPDSIVAHTRQQTYYFADDGLLRRIDYSVDILGGGPAVHYPSDYHEFDGIMMPRRRRVYVRNPDGTPVPEPLAVSIDMAEISFS